MKQFQKMSPEEKMLAIDKELRKLQAESVRLGYSAAQVEAFASPFLEASLRARREKWVKRGAGVLVLVCACYLLLQFNSPYRLAASVSRAGLIKTSKGGQYWVWESGREFEYCAGYLSKTHRQTLDQGAVEDNSAEVMVFNGQVLALWDWTQVYHSNCLLANPLYTQPETLILDDCQICEAIQSIQHVQNVDSSEVVEKFFRRDIPIIVDDGLYDWDDVSIPHTPQQLAEFFDEDEVLRSGRGCGFSSNIRNQQGGHREFLNTLLQESISQYYAHWENCQIRAAKMLRGVYRRPYFLPPAVETSATNWVFLAHNYTGTFFKRVAIDQPLVMLLQVSGQVDIQVEPWTPCEELCPVLRDTLHAGQVLVITEFLWKASYLPSSNSDFLAIGFGASF